MNDPDQQYMIEDNLDSEEDAPLSKAERAKKYAADLQIQFAALPMAIFADVRSKRLRHRDVCLYAHLLVKQGVHRSTYWGIDSLAILTGTNATSIKDSLSRLLKCGHIKRRRGTGTTRTYCLTKLPPGEGAKGILVKGRKVGEMPLEEPESEPALPPVRRTLHPIPGHHFVQQISNPVSKLCFPEQDDDEPFEFF